MLERLEGLGAFSRCLRGWRDWGLSKDKRDIVGYLMCIMLVMVQIILVD